MLIPQAVRRGGIMLRLLGLFICLATIFSAMMVIGLHYFFDMPALLLVTAGAIGYGLLTSGEAPFIRKLGEGAVYFGWLGTLIGLIAMTSGAFEIWGDISKLGPALGVAMLTLFYGYVIKLICRAADA